MPKKCLICDERRPRVRLVCGHLTACETCIEDLTQCPVCRHAIPLSEGIPGGYMSSGSSTYHSPRSTPGPPPPSCFRAGCRGPPDVDFRCPTCPLRYNLCHDCARRWVCPFCNGYSHEQAANGGFSDQQADDRGNADERQDEPSSSTSTAGLDHEKCYTCSIEDAVFKFQCPNCRCGIYMLCAGCGPVFACHRCFTAALPNDLHLVSASSASSASLGQPMDRPRPHVQQGGSSSSTMPP